MQGMVALGTSLGVGKALAQDDPASMPPQIGDVLVRTRGEDKTTPLTANDIEVAAAPIEAWAMDPASGTVRNGSNFHRLLVSRWAPGDISEEAQAFAAEGVIAHTIICTHAACEVTDWVADEQVLECPCHFSRFSPKDGAEVVSGPARRHLPMLTLEIAEDDSLTVAAQFDSQLGGDA